MKNIFYYLIFLLSVTISYSQAGTNDNTFNTTDVGNGMGDGPNDKVLCSAKQTDGKILIGGSFTIYNGTPINYIARLNVDGTLDNSFNVGTGTNNDVKTIAIQNDGKILIGGSFTTFNGLNAQHITRLNTDGSKDSSFVSGPGTTDNDVNAIAITSDGKILIGGDFLSYLGYGLHRFACLNADGTVNGPFILNLINNTVNTINIQNDGKIVLGGAFTLVAGATRNRIARLNSNGALDTTFVPSGANNTVNAVAIQSDGKILLGGTFTTYGVTTANRLCRITSTGSIDSTFNTSGTGIQGIIDPSIPLPDDSAVNSIAIRSTGNILVGGVFAYYNSATVRHLIEISSNGSITSNNNFPINNIVTTNEPRGIFTILLLSNDDFLIGGNYFSLFNHRFLNKITNNSFNLSFNPGTGVSYQYSSSAYPLTTKGIALQNDGKIIIYGDFFNYNSVRTPGIARLNSDGSLDTAFNLITSGKIGALAVQSDGKLIASITSLVANISSTNIYRLNVDGTIDPTFNSFPGGANVIKIQEDGKILLGSGSLTRLNPNGTLDTTFNSTGSIVTGGIIYDILITSMSVPNANAGTITIVGNFDLGINKKNIACVNSQGQYIFWPGRQVMPNGPVYCIAGYQDDYRSYVVGGSFNSCGVFPTTSNTFNNMIGYNHTNSGLPMFQNQVATNGAVKKILVQCDNKLIICGDFTSFDGVPRNGIARINVDGTLDTTFNPGIGASGISTMALQNDGKVLIGGTFTSYNNIGRNRIGRVLNDIINVYPEQTIGAITGTNNVCKGSTQTYTVPVVANANNYTWTLPVGASIVTNNGNSIVVNFDTATAVSGNITVKGTNDCGSSNTASLPVNVFSPISSAVSITGSSNVCIGSTYTYSLPSDTNVISYQWTLPNGASGSSTSNSISVTFSSSAVSGNITVKRINACGTSSDTVLPITIVVTPADAGAISGQISVCRYQTFTYSVPNINGAINYLWTYPSGVTGPSTTTTNSTTITIPPLFVSGTITVKGGNGCGTYGGVSSLTINANITNPPTAGNNSFCATSNPTVSNLSAIGTDIKWYDNINSVSPLISSTPLINSLYYATQTINGCESGKIQVNVNLIQPPTAPTTVSANVRPFCQGETIQSLTDYISIEDMTNNAPTYAYNSLTGGNSLPPNTLLLNGMTYYISQSDYNITCESPRTPITIGLSVTPPPTGNTIQSFTPGQTIANLQVTGSNLQWYDSNNNSISPSTLLTNGTTYYVTQSVSHVFYDTFGFNHDYTCTSNALAITVTSALGLNQNHLLNISSNPNPVKDVLFIKCNEIIKDLSVYNSLGQLLITQKENLNEVNFDLSNLPTGNYFVKVESNDKKQVIKITKI